MHDLINDLAKSIAGEFCYNNVDGSDQPSEKTRHFFYKRGNGHNALEELESCSKTEFLRTFFMTDSFREDETGQVVNLVHRLLPRLGRLRVLHLTGHFHWKDERIDISDFVSSAKHLRYMSLHYIPILSLPEAIGDMKDLRYLFLKDNRIESLPNSIGNLKNLWYLTLWEREIKALPDSIGNLKELRVLLVKSSSIERLPESFCGLYNLQYLMLPSFRLVELPAKMMDLISLCHLDISGTKLKSMPPQMGKLVKLHTLTDFFVGKDRRGSSIAELGHLGNLQGKLRLQNLQNVGDVQDALEAKIKDKSHLVTLGYYWTKDDDSNAGTHDGSVDVSLLQHLQPNVNVKRIKIEGYRGTNFPNWVGDSSFSNIVKLSLINCKDCTCLPPVGQLASLEDLYIQGFDSIVSVGAEFFGDSKSIQPFRSLKHLHFIDMPKCQEWTWTENERQVFPLLQSLIISACPELEMAFTQGIFPSTLQKLEIKDCNKIISNRMNWDLLKYSSLSEFILKSAPDIGSFPGMILLPSTLTNIEIDNLKNLKSLDSGLQHLISLRTLYIYKCPNLGCIPDEGLPESLNLLSISDCPPLEERCQREQGEDWPKISRIQRIHINNCII